MDCPEISKHLQDFLHGELSPGLMRGVQVHLGGCSSCRTALHEARRTADVVVPFYVVPLIHGELTRAERVRIEAHLAYCEPCREEYERLRAASNELVKNLSQYQLSRLFRQRVMQEWKPHRAGRRTRYTQRGLADMIERAEAGNTFSYERHVDRYKDYAYIAAYLAVRDFHWAAEIARTLFVRGMPVFPGDLTHAGFLEWLGRQTTKIAQKGAWLGKDEEVGETGEGLSGYEGSRKLRRHRLILEMFTEFEEPLRIPFLLYHVQRMNYAEIGSLLELPRLDVMRTLGDTTQAALDALRADDRAHPRRRRVWEH